MNNDLSSVDESTLPQLHLPPPPLPPRILTCSLDSYTALFTPQHNAPAPAGVRHVIIGEKYFNQTQV